MLAKLEFNEDTDEVFLPIPEGMLKELGWSEGDLVEIVPMGRHTEGQFVEYTIHIRRPRM